jgi:seryl-tRNA synthetase
MKYYFGLTRWTLIEVRCRASPCLCARLFIFIKGAKIAGHRGYFLTNDGIDLNHALIAYGLEFLRERGYKKIQPPFMMNKDQMAKTAQLDQFDEELYKVRRPLVGTFFKN